MRDGRRSFNTFESSLPRFAAPDVMSIKLDKSNLSISGLFDKNRIIGGTKAAWVIFKEETFTKSQSQRGRLRGRGARSQVGERGGHAPPENV